MDHIHQTPVCNSTVDKSIDRSIASKIALTAPTVKTNRAVASVNASYWIEKDTRLSLGIYYSQQSLNTSNCMTEMLTYTVGM